MPPIPEDRFLGASSAREAFTLLAFASRARSYKTLPWSIVEAMLAIKRFAPMGRSYNAHRAGRVANDGYRKLNPSYGAEMRQPTRYNT
ncbi:hypothetical protein D9M71_675370 [compost metagenome]